MGVINLKWREATTTAGEFFTQAERNTGWPEKLNYGQLWALQYPCDKGDAVKYKVALERGLDIGAACKRGDLAYTLTPATADVLSNLWTYAVTAPAFAGWLAAQGETPSPYIAAWFEAVDTATLAPVVDAGIEFALLATRAQLIAAFGVFTGMENSWFKNLKDTPKLKDARKVAGSGGRASTEPLYCPFEVMRWLTDPKRKKGRRLMPDKGWQLLESHFLKVYNKNSIGDTRTD